MGTQQQQQQTHDKQTNRHPNTDKQTYKQTNSLETHGTHTCTNKLTGDTRYTHEYKQTHWRHTIHTRVQNKLIGDTRYTHVYKQTHWRHTIHPRVQTNSLETHDPQT